MATTTLPPMRRLAALAGILVLAASIRAQGLGIPFIRNFTPKEYGAEAQNWAVVQGPSGLVYAANNQGVLVYDGVRWRVIRTPNRTTVRSLAADAEGRIFVGAVGEIGFLAPDASGRMAFVSLAGKLPPEAKAFTDVWTTRATPQGILFQSREELMLYRDGAFKVWKAGTTFHVAFCVGGRIFVRQREVGLQELAGGALKLVPGGERFAKESVFAMLPMKDGILVGSRNLGLWKLTDAALLPFPSEADARLKTAALYAGAPLQDGSLALATTQGGLVALDERGRIRLVLDQTSGLIGDNVKAVYPDGHGSIWLALDNGLARVEWPSPFTWLDKRQGLKGTVWSMLRHDGRLFVATGQGAYALAPAPDGGLAAFQPIANTQAQSLRLFEMDGHLLLANARGVLEIKGDAAVPVRPSSNVAISFLRSKRDPARLFVGLQGGLASLRWSNGTWLDEGAVPGVTDDIYAMGEDGEGRLWLGTEAQGLLRLTFPPGWPGVAPRIDRFGVANGLPSANQILIADTGKDLVFGTHGGMYRFDEASNLFGPDPRFAKLLGGAARWVKTMAQDASGRLWIDAVDEAAGTHETGVARPALDGTYDWDALGLRRVADVDVEAIYPDQEGVVWLGGPEGIARFDSTLSRAADPPFPAIISSAETKDGRAVPLFGSAPRLPFSRNGIAFEFAAPGLDQPSAAQYQVFLEGFDRDWGPWTAETRKEYTNLREGAYRFRVRARNIYGRATEESAFAFRVLPPWYRAWWAWLLWALCAAGALALAIRARTRLLRERNARLEARIGEATEELREREQLLGRQAADLAIMNRDLTALNEQKDQYLGLVVHDLRNPLNGILLSAEMLAEEATDDATRRRAARIADTAAEMGGLIGRFLDIAAIDAGKVQAHLAPCDLAALVSGAVEAFSPQADVKGITLRTVAPAGHVEALADPAFAKEILANLLSNAIKFSPAGKVVTLRLEDAPGEAILSVEDEGPGLTDEDKRRLFGRFARLTAQPTGGEGSVGLGLSIVKHMVEACGGRIWADSAEGRGAAFRVEFRKG